MQALSQSRGCLLMMDAVRGSNDDAVKGLILQHLMPVRVTMRDAEVVGEHVKLLRVTPASGDNGDTGIRDEQGKMAA